MRGITETGNCTRDDLHEHLSPNRTVALADPCQRMVHSLCHSGREYLHRDSRCSSTALIHIVAYSAG